MRTPTTLLITAAVAALVAPLAASASAAPSGNGLSHRNVPVCDRSGEGASCDAIRNDTVDSSGTIQPHAIPSGYGPADLRAAYGLGSGGTGKTVAIVDAYDDPNALPDVNTYRSTFGLPALNSSGGPTFRKTGQSGGGTPRANGGWAQEISLDLDMVSAACPSCSILLVEAKSASFSDLGTGVNYAATQRGVVAISNSYGGSDTAASSAYDHPGIAVTASTGDNGYGVQSPASYPHVVAVGGTSLHKGSTGYTESAWSGAGSGCSTLNANPGWQTGTACSGKANADVSAVADPNTGVAVYDSFTYQGASGWLVFGGTSASSPIIASAYAQGPSFGLDAGKFTWTNRAQLHDVTTGSNGTCPTPVWCTSGSGWDGPTGLGTPTGSGAF